MIFATAAAAVVVPSVSAPAFSGRRQTFVLVHGAWHGGWVWRDVALYLRELNHTVFTPTLTGLGERRHLANRRTDLDTHIEDICNVIKVEELSDVILVGHSYAGMVITGVASRLQQRIARVVYLDAVVPTDGKSMFDYQSRGAYEKARRTALNGWLMPPPNVKYLGLDTSDPQTGGWVERQLTPHPIATWKQPLKLVAPIHKPRQFIHCVQPNLAGLFDKFAEDASRTHGWQLHELRTGHDAMVTQPKALGQLLIQEPSPSE